MKIITPRPRQEKAIEDLRAAYRRGFKAPVMIAPTGFGKSATAICMIQSAIEKGKRVWFIAHLKEILRDTSHRLTDADIPHGWIAAGQDGNHRQAVQVAMVQTLVRRLDRFQPPDLIIVDEAHLAVANTYQQIFEWAGAGPKFKRPGGAHLLHLTATPCRLDGRGLGEVADILVPTCSTQDLIDEALLAPIRYYAPSEPDLSGVHTSMGDFNQGELAEAMDKPVITGSAVQHYRKLAHGRPAVAFCVTVEHANNVAEQFRQAGYRALAISGESGGTERDAALQGLRDGSLDVVCNCALWVAGVDAPSIGCIIQLAPTQSVVKYLQSVGRGLRTYPGKTDCLILDHAGNVKRHGLPTDLREWTLEPAEKKKSSKKSEVPVKTCPVCFATMPSEVTDCSCGHHFEPVAREIEHVDGELEEITTAAKAEAVKTRKAEQGRSQTEADLIRIGRARGMKRPELWARHVLRARHAKEAAR
ncbi:DEAD/DEAH box helicase [Polaromonas sp.]|uniref:DEAD/DEAH box helicase n=1 Tax=Polaromonas sp. TaxID=1869339 RepID=UPI00356985AB